MPGDVGLVAKAIDTIASWFFSEDGFNALRKRRALRAKKKECQDALAENRWDDLRRLTAEYDRLSQQP